MLINSSFDTWYTISLIVIISISTLIEYYFGITYRLFLQAKQKEYIISIISIITHILTIISIIILIKCNVSIQIIKLVSAIIFIIRPIIQYIYVKRKHNINLKQSNKNYVFKQKWKDAIKLHLWERSRHKNLSSPHEALVLEMVAAEAIAGYTFWLSHPYETNEADIKRLLVYTLGMLE